MFIELPTKAHDLTGRRFSRLVAIGPVKIRRYTGTTHVIWRCACDCGMLTDVSAVRLKNGQSKSCGCYKIEQAGKPNTKHGMCRKNTIGESYEYRAWRHMKDRCLNVNDTKYKDYGGRGIQIYEPWVSNFDSFLKHIGPRPCGTSLDRIDNNGNYEPGNIRWATPSQQAKNRRQFTAKPRKLITFKGKTQGMSEWARELGLPFYTIQNRIRRGQALS